MADTPRRLLPWMLELSATLPALVRSYLPGAPIDPHVREEIILAVADVNGCRYCAWIHGSWRAFLGDGPHDDIEQVLLTHARACAEAGRPLPLDELSAVLPPAALRGVRATVAQVGVASFVGNTFDRLRSRATGRTTREPIGFTRDAITVAAALPVAVPMFATAAAMRLATRVAPPIPEIDVPDGDDANLLVHLLVTVAPVYLSNAVVRLASLGLPRPIAVGVRSGRTAATIRVGRGTLSIENGIGRDTVVVVEGEVEALLQTATGSIVRELGGIRIRPS
ncbi:MAG TPA: hypothetical protein VFV00_18720 [Acidimicrobiales bacterium]|nr:hypothetical protein [Acidimicrobiales bacterium]